MRVSGGFSADFTVSLESSFVVSRVGAFVAGKIEPLSSNVVGGMADDLMLFSCESAVRVFNVDLYVERGAFWFCSLWSAVDLAFEQLFFVGVDLLRPLLAGPFRYCFAMVEWNLIEVTGN